MDQVGAPEVLRWAEMPDPVPAAGEALVKVAVAGLNYFDTYQRSGLYPVALPFSPGVEGAGTVVAVGDGVTSLAVDDRVAWPSGSASYAQLVALPADRLVQVPESVDFDVAGAVLLQGMTAHFLATDTYHLGPDSKCLVHAGAGGVGLLLIQIAKSLGAEVFTTVGSPDKVDLVHNAGADHVIQYRNVDFGDAITAIAGPRPLDVVYDGVGAAVFETSLGLLRRRGMMVTFGNASGAVPPVSPLTLMAHGSVYLVRPTLFDYVVERSELERRASDLFDWIAAGRLDVRIGARFALCDAADAHRALEGRTTTGKVLLDA